MRKDLIDIVCCPDDKAKLALQGERLDDHGDVVSGTLCCTECGFGYPVEDGIPNLLPPAYHVGRTGKKAAKAPAKKAAKSPAKKAGQPPGAAKAQTGAGAPGTEVAQVSGAAKPEDASPEEREAVADEE